MIEVKKETEVIYEREGVAEAKITWYSIGYFKFEEGTGDNRRELLFSASEDVAGQLGDDDLLNIARSLASSRGIAELVFINDVCEVTFWKVDKIPNIL